MGIRARIVWPFLALFVSAFAVLIAVSIYLITGAVERRMADQVETLSRFVSTQPFVLGMLDPLKRAYNADMVVVRPADRIVTRTTLASNQLPEFTEFLRKHSDLFQPGKTVHALLGGINYEAARTRITAQQDPVDFYVLFPGRWIADEKAKVVQPLLTVAIPAALLVILLGYITARRIAQPIVTLAGQARAMASGQLDGKIETSAGSGEVAELARALTVMVEGLRKYQEVLVQAERMATMGHMAAGVAHEIRNPLTSLKMTLQMLARKAAPEEKDSFALLLREIERLELAVSELITASQQVKLNKERAELSRVVDDVLDLLSRQLEHLSVRIEKKYNEASPVEIDVGRFKRAIMNLILNGAQTMAGPVPVGTGSEGKVLTVTTEKTGDGTVRLSVQDCGPGIPEELRNKIFEPFVTTKPGGTGLGLSVTKRVVEEHGGRMGFDTGPSGTTFWIELPYVENSDR